MVIFFHLANQPARKITTDLPEVLVTHSFRINITNLKHFIKTADRDRTVSQRSKPNSRTTLMGEQPNPWNIFHLQDVMSRHRGAKQTFR